MSINTSDCAFAQSDVFIDNNQSNELENEVNIVRRDYDDIVEEVIKDSSNVDTQRAAMRQIWDRDCTRKQAKETFSKEQAPNDVSNNGSRQTWEHKYGRQRFQ